MTITTSAFLRRGFLLAVALASLTLVGCARNLYMGDPPAHKLPPPCADLVIGDWVAEGTPPTTTLQPAPTPAGAAGFTITKTNVLVAGSPPVDLGSYQVLGAAGAAVELGGIGPAPVRIVCNAEDKIQIDDGTAPGHRTWFYRRVK